MPKIRAFLHPGYLTLKSGLIRNEVNMILTLFEKKKQTCLKSDPDDQHVPL